MSKGVLREKDKNKGCNYCYIMVYDNVDKEGLVRSVLWIEMLGCYDCGCIIQ